MSDVNESEANRGVDLEKCDFDIYDCNGDLLEDKGSFDDDLYFEFEPCSYCDQPDACCDFAECAIKTGLCQPPIGYNGIF